MTIPKGPPSASTIMLRFVPFFAAIRRVLANFIAAMTGLAHCPVGRLPSPLDSIQCITLLDESSPDFIQNTLLFPPLEGAVNRAVVAEFPGQLIPLASRTSTIDNAVQCLALVDPGSTCRIGRVEIFQDFGDHCPKVVRNTPKCGQQLRGSMGHSTMDGIESAKDAAEAHPMILAIKSMQRADGMLTSNRRR